VQDPNCRKIARYRSADTTSVVVTGSASAERLRL
jgi:hypothetical protein